MSMIHEVAIENFLTCDEKPLWCKPSDILILLYLMSQADPGGQCATNTAKISMCTGLSTGNLSPTRNAIVRLYQHGWIDIQFGKGGTRDIYTVLFDHIPPNPQPLEEEHEHETEG